MQDDIHAFHYTGTAYRSTIYTPFTLSVPSEIGMSGDGSAGEGEDGNAAPQGAPHRAPVVFEEDGWTQSADGLQSTQNNPLTATTPVGEPWVMFLLAIAYIFLRGKRLRTAAMVLLLAAIPAAATTVSLTIQNSTIRTGEKVIVAPTVTFPPEGKSFLCWELYHDEACAYPVEGVSFAYEEALYNKIYFMAPAAGRYYLQTKMRSLFSCNGGTEVATEKTAVDVYPGEAAAVLVRSHQRAGQQIALDEETDEPQTVYGVMQFDKSTIHNEALTASQRYNYFISFPFDVRVGDITGFGTYGRHWLIEYYDGLGRAQNGYWADSEPNWKRITDTDSLLHAYQGYLLKLNSKNLAADKTDIWGEGNDHLTLYFPSQTPVLLTHANETIPALGGNYHCTIDYSATLGTDADRRKADSYWRCIGVPGEAGYRLTGAAFVYQCNPDNSLSTVEVEDWTYEPTHAYLTQSSNAIIWHAPERAGVPAKMRNANERSSIRIELQQEGEEKDRTFIRLSEEEKVTEGFEFGADLAKEMNTGANIYTLIGTTRAAGNSLPESGQKVVVPIGVQVAEAGEYTFAMPSDSEGRSVILADHSTGTRTDLALGGYTTTVPQGCTDQRFSVEITPRAATPTGTLAPSISPHEGAYKKIVDGALYIVHDGEVYNARGIRIRNGKWLR